MCDCDDNSPKFYGRIDRKARKPHRCSECRRVISKGEIHTVHSGLWEGWDTFRVCAHCTASLEVAQSVWREVYRREYPRSRAEPICFCFTGLWEAIEDSFGDWDGRYDSAIARLIVSARRKWTHRRGARTGQLMPMPEAKPVPIEAV